MNFSAVYSDRQVAPLQRPEGGGFTSPSTQKPKVIAAALKAAYPDIQFIEPEPLDRCDFYLAHSTGYVDGVFDKRIKNGFGTYSDEVNASLPYTNGAMFTACKAATATKPSCALVSGFHHAGYEGHDERAWFCTFNGLVIAAMKMNRRVAIIDADMHYGDGTDDILQHMVKMGPPHIFHYTFGQHYRRPSQAKQYLDDLQPVYGRVSSALQEYKPELIIYQSGADVHVDDPFGGVLNEQQMQERDECMFTIAKVLGVPLAWCLAGGYQVDKDGGLSAITRFHMNTFKACDTVYGQQRAAA